MPGLSVRRNLAGIEPAHLVTDDVQRFVGCAADRHVRLGADQFDQPGAPFCGIAGRDQRLDHGRHPRRRRRRRQAEIGRADDFTLAHWNAAEQLDQIFAKRDPNRVLLDLAQPFGRAHALDIGDKLADRLDIGRQPGQAMRCPLLPHEQALDDAAVDRHAPAHADAGVGQERLGRLHRLARHHDKVMTAIDCQFRSCHRFS